MFVLFEQHFKNIDFKNLLQRNGKKCPKFIYLDKATEPLFRQIPTQKIKKTSEKHNKYYF